MGNTTPKKTPRQTFTKAWPQFQMRDVEKQFLYEKCEIKGKIPPYVKGKFYRQAGGAFLDVDKAFLDGLAHVARWEINSSENVTFKKHIGDCPWP